MPIGWIGFLTKIATWIIQNFGEEIVVLGKNGVTKGLQYIFKKRVILILGVRESGKTSLIHFMHTGKPYIDVDGERQSPNPTLGAVIVDEEIEVSKSAEKRWGKIEKDVSGDFRDLWKQLIAELDPDGIVYMIDGRLENDGLKESIQEIFSDVLSEYKHDLRKLKVLHIFANFADIWSKNSLTETRKINQIRECFEETRLEYPNMTKLSVMASATQLSPKLNAWPETIRALEHFGADLASKK
jgi:hypothetical protein